MHNQSIYQSKLTTPEAAIQHLPAQGNIALGMAVSAPPALLLALEKRIQAGSIDDLRVYYMHSEVPLHASILNYDYMHCIKPHPFYIRAIERHLIAEGLKEGRNVVFYMPGNFSSVPRILADIGIDVFLLTVSPMDDAGFFSCGTNADYSIPTARQAKKLIVEVNPNMPRVFGDSCVHVSDVDVIVEHACPLIDVPARPLTALDKAIGALIVEMVPDYATLQIGIGGVPNAICEMLIHHKGLGIHSELMGPGLARLIQSGVVTNEHKKIHPYKSVYTFAMGDKEMYTFLNNNPSMEAYSVDHVNDPCVIGKLDTMVSINAFLQVDLMGQVNAEFINGRQYSAPGGQLDFVRGAQRSKGGKSILTAYSTAVGGTISRIIPQLEGPATDPRADTHYIVTEYGVANLRGKSIAERAKALIELAHPNFRDMLLREAHALGYL